jgi:hypothetical protein
MENIPTDYVNGTDFRLSKTMKGQYADYSTSKWARKERSLDETELASVDTNGLYNLKDYLPKKPTEAEVDIIYQMFQDSVNGELFDNEKYGEHFRPNGQSAPVKLQATTPPAQSTTPVAPVTAPAVETPAPVVETPAPVVAPVVETASANESPTTDSKASAEDILAMIRNRQQ